MSQLYMCHDCTFVSTSERCPRCQLCDRGNGESSPVELVPAEFRQLIIQPMQPQPPKAPHGKGCECRECRKANREKMN